MPQGLRKVLIADNDEDVLLALERALENEGYDTVVALNSDEVTRALAHNSCDLLVLDDYLSGRDSVHVLAELRRAGIIPVVVITYHHFPSFDARQNLHSLGVSAFISKQAHSELVEIVRYLLEPNAQYRDALSSLT